MEGRAYVCKRLRMCNYLMDKGFEPYKVAPDRNNPKYNVFIFTATPDLNQAVIEYINKIPKSLRKDKKI